MVKIIDRPPSFSEQIARLLGSGIGSGFQQGIKEGKKRKTEIAKSLKGLSSSLSRELKSRRRETVGPQQFEDLLKASSELVAAGVPQDQAFSQVIQDFYGMEKPQEKPDILQKLLGSVGLSDQAGAKFGEMKRPFPTKMGNLSEDALLNLIKKKPGTAAGSLGIGAISPIEELATFTSDPLMRAAELVGMMPERKTLSGESRKLLERDLESKERKAAGQLEFLGSLIPIEALIGRLGIGKKALQGLKKAPSEAKAAELLGKAEKEAAPLARELPKSLEGRVGKAPETATEMRIQRAKPKERLYPAKERAAIREEQLKRHPRYVAEIEADAAKRAAQAEARIPKTVRGKDAQRLRQVAAEKRLPTAQDSYYRSAGRLRALEDEIAKLPAAQKKELEPLLKMAKEDLQDATFNLKQASENLKGVSYRASKDEMKAAARKKLDGIRDLVESGEDIKLAKMDYSPDLIKEAKRLSKRKPIPYSPKSDFYNQVHETYLSEYRNQLKRIQDEMGRLMKQPSMASIARRQQLAKERDVLRKMIESGEAEQKIHQHKFGLREMAERKKAAERLAKLKPAEGKPKVKAAAQQKMWRERVKEIGTAEGRAKLAEDVVEEAAREAKSPKMAEQIRKEKREFSKALDDLNIEKEKISDSLKMENLSKEPSMKDVQSYTKKIKNFQNKVDALLSKVPILGKTELGKDAIAGVIGGIWDALNDEFKFSKVSGGRVLSFALGRGYMRGALRSFISQESRSFLKERFKEAKIEQAIDALKRNDEEKFQSFKPSIKKEAKERVFR